MTDAERKAMAERFEEVWGKKVWRMYETHLAADVIPVGIALRFTASELARVSAPGQQAPELAEAESLIRVGGPHGPVRLEANERAAIADGLDVALVGRMRDVFVDITNQLDWTCLDLARAAIAHIGGEVAKLREELAEKTDARQAQMERAYRAEIESDDLRAKLAREEEKIAEQAATIERLTRERDEARVGLGMELDDRKKHLADLDLVRTDTEGVWRWQGDGHDDPASLSCPVVMSAERLRELLTRKTAPKTEGEPQ